MQTIYLVVEIIDLGYHAHYAFKDKSLAEKECEKLNEGKDRKPFEVEAIPIINAYVV